MTRQLNCGSWGIFNRLPHTLSPVICVRPRENVFIGLARASLVFPLDPSQTGLASVTFSEVSPLGDYLTYWRSSKDYRGAGDLFPTKGRDFSASSSKEKF